MTLTCEYSDADNWDMPERSHKSIPLSEKVKIFSLIKEKKSYAGIARNYGKNQSSVCETEKKEK